MLSTDADPDRALRLHRLQDDGLRQALADGSPAAIAAAVTRIRQDEATALARLRATMQA
ncbi:hypothetical protein [Inquilinus sp.]|jgi:hypothetical protein|uniref:hypothetical protein n=1 Tax=Inquilinus sp. TaxID=1932117 RepID=UPI003782F5A2